ncbi:major capsid protein [Microvirus mar15]|uniref:Major capsid protein n=1 Tax=Microvirus mar15 TaxID=2851147 RepID=A0A8F5XT51_9VIRU|nr:major capsid protein [Microvirus mar15]
MSNFTFNDVPVIRHSRSRFDLSHSIKTSGNVGTLYPFEIQEVYAGDTFKIKTSIVSRLSSQFIRPVMDNLFLDVYYFFVPSRLLYDKYVNVFGENTESEWANTVEYSTPTVASGSGVSSGTVGDYLGLPPNFTGEVSVLPFRAFAKVYNEWFRDQNNVQPMHIQTGETASSEAFNNNAWSPNNYMGLPPKVAKFHDYFTSSLPAPQKGSAVDLSLGIAQNVPVITGDEHYQYVYPAADIPLRFQGIAQSQSSLPSVAGLYGTDQGNVHTLKAGDVSISGQYGTFSTSGNAGSIEVNGLIPSNLWAQTENLQFNPVSVNDLRFAFQYQKMLERDARSGSRYVEYLSAHFGVQAGDYRLQRSEFLGGRRFPINIQQVVQSTGAGSDTSPLGELGAYSLSNGSTRVTKSFVENGFVIGVYCIRQFHTYQQGVEKFWRRSKRTDYYDPVFSHIGEQPVYKTELFAEADVEAVFGYNEAWADLRYRPNRVTGQMRSGVTNSLDVWHFADYYSTVPSLNEQFINETPTYVDRAITVDSSAQNQFILDFYVSNVAYRVLPTYSVPSLIDHD